MARVKVILPGTVVRRIPYAGSIGFVVGQGLSATDRRNLAFSLSEAIRSWLMANGIALAGRGNGPKVSIKATGAVRADR